MPSYSFICLTTTCKAVLISFTLFHIFAVNCLLLLFMAIAVFLTLVQYDDLILATKI